MISDSASQDLHQKAHERVTEQLFRNLQKARDKAAQKSSYDWKLTHGRLYSEFKKRFGADAHEWQIQVTEAILLGLDSVVIAGTGSGHLLCLLWLMPHEKYLLYLHSKFCLYINNAVSAGISRAIL